MTWLALGDWGTTRLRLTCWRDGQAAGLVEGPGIGGLDRPPADVLREALAQLTPEPPAAIRLCGMAGARGALHEAAYAPCPAGVAEWIGAAWRGRFDGVPLRIAAGLAAQDAAGRPDVMRGEETQLFGALAQNPQLADGRALFVLPGTHSKWAMANGGRIETFRTFLTGELFALLTRQSTLVPRDAGAPDDDDAGFTAGLARAADGAGLAGSLFEARSAQLRLGRSAGWAREFLSGLLIGDEVRTMQRRADAGAVVLIGAAGLCDRYERALRHFGGAVTRMDGDACALRGLEMLHDDDG